MGDGTHVVKLFYFQIAERITEAQEVKVLTPHSVTNGAPSTTLCNSDTTGGLSPLGLGGGRVLVLSLFVSLVNLLALSVGHRLESGLGCSRSPGLPLPLPYQFFLLNI